VRDGPRPTSTFFYTEEVWYRNVAVPAGRSVGRSLLLSSHTSAAAAANPVSQQQLSTAACHGFDGIMWIRRLRQQDDDEDDTSSASAMLWRVAEQLKYAHLHNLVPWVYLTDNIGHLFDPKVHYISIDATEHYYYPQEQSDGTYRLAVVGSGSPQPRRDDLHNGIWNSYFAPVRTLPRTTDRVKVCRCLYLRIYLQQQQQHIKAPSKLMPGEASNFFPT
jgi:hypothetical protein